MLDLNQIAPDFSLPLLDGGEFHFYETMPENAVLIFYKYTCGTSKFTLPFVQNIFEAYGDTIPFAAIAQDEADPTRHIRKELGLTMPFLLDRNPYPVSSVYGLHTVPSIFLVGPDRKIRISTYGFVKQELLNLADTLAEKTTRAQIDVFKSEQIPEMKPG